MKLYKKIDKYDEVRFVPVAVPQSLKEEFKTFILKDKMIEDLALYLATSSSGKSYKLLANEIVNLVFLKENA